MEDDGVTNVGGEENRSYICGQVADPCLEEVIFHGPFHEVTGDGGFGDFLIVLDRFVIIARDGGEIGHL